MTVSRLDDVAALLTRVHDRGVVNETALIDVLQQLAAGQTLTLEHLMQIFGVAPMFHLVATAPDETARQLVREAADAFTNPETVIDLRDWIRSAEALLGSLRMPTVDRTDRAALMREIRGTDA